MAADTTIKNRLLWRMGAGLGITVRGTRHFSRRALLLLVLIPMFVLTLVLALPVHMPAHTTASAPLVAHQTVTLTLDSECSPFASLNECISLASAEPSA
jgi:hypothetical protein